MYVLNISLIKLCFFASMLHLKKFISCCINIRLLLPLWFFWYVLGSSNIKLGRLTPSKPNIYSVESNPNTGPSIMNFKLERSKFGWTHLWRLYTKTKVWPCLARNESNPGPNVEKTELRTHQNQEVHLQKSNSSKSSNF